MRSSVAVLTLFTKEGCTLCDVVKAVISRAERQWQPPPTLRLVEVDIAAPHRSLWYERYKYDIPVVHLNGKFLAKHRLPKEVLQEALTAVRTSGKFPAQSGDPNPDIDAGPTPME